MAATVRLRIDPEGQVTTIYSDEAAPMLQALGPVAITRASHVEPASGGWTADMRPVGGPILGPFALRGEALAAEVKWLQENKGL